MIHGTRALLSEGLMDWREVRRRWNAMSGENLSRSRVWQIGLRAEAKLRVLLADLEPECEGPRFKIACSDQVQPSRQAIERCRRALAEDVA